MFRRTVLKRVMLFLLLLFVSIIAIPVTAHSLSAPLYPPDTTYRALVTSQPPMPPYNGWVEDISTSIRLMRITQGGDPLYDSGYPAHAYAKHQVWNIDATMYKFYSVAIYDAATHEMIRALPGVLYESFWSNTDPDLIYSFRPDGTIRTYTVSTEAIVDLDHLEGYDIVRVGPGEGNIDIHDRYVALTAKRGEDFDLVIFDLQQPGVVVSTTFTGAWGTGGSLAEHIDWASVSQSGHYVVINWDSGPPWDVQPFDGHYGVEVYETTTLSFTRRLVRYGNHGDLCFTPTGEEVYVQFWGEEGTINAYDLATGATTVIQTDDDFGVGDAHISCRNILRPGWAYVSTDPSRGGMVVAVKLDGSGTVEYFGHHFSTASTYDKSPMPVPSPLGDVVMFKSDFGDDSDPLEVYEFEAQYVAFHHIMLPMIFR